MKFLIEQHIDLAQENAPMVYAQPLIGGDSDAHEWRVTVTKRGEKADIPTGSVLAYVRRDIVCEDWEEEPALKVTGSASGNVISVVLPSDVYTMGCPLVAVVRVAEADGRIVSLAVLRATSEKLIPGAVYDPDGEIINLDALLAQIENTKAAAAAANEAAQKASAAAEHAPCVEAATGLWMCWDAGAGKYVSNGVPATGPKGEGGEDGLTPYIGGNGNWWIGENDTGTKAQGPAGQNGTGSGTVTGVKLNGQTYQPDSAGVVELPEMGSGAEIDDEAASAEKVYSSQKVEEIAGQLSEQITTLESAKLGKTEQAADSAKLGGVAADQYALKTDVPENTGGASEGLISDEYSANKTYNSGDYCISENALYKCLHNNVTGIAPQDIAYWEHVSITNEIAWLYNMVKLNNIVINNQSTSDVKVLMREAIALIGSAKGVPFPAVGNVMLLYFGNSVYGNYMTLFEGGQVTTFCVRLSTANNTTTYFTEDWGETWTVYN